MHSVFPRRVFALCVFAALCSCLGCGEDRTASSPGQGVSPGDNVTAVDDHAVLSAGQLLSLAEEKLDAEKYEEAIDLFTILVKQAPTATKYAMLGDCYWKQRELERADVHYREALALDPKHCGANHALGRDAVLLKRYQDAIPYLDAASEVCVGTPVYAQNLRFRVEAMVELGRIAEAQLDMQKLLIEYPDNRNTYEAGILLANGKGDDALAAEYQGKLDAIRDDGSKSAKAEP